MSDVLEGGRPRRPPPRWVWVLAGLAVVAGGVAFVVTRGGSHGSAAPAPASSPARSPSPSPAPTPTPTPMPTPAGSGVTSASATAALWPNIPGACGWTAYLPLIAPAHRYDPVSATVIVGGAGLQSVTADGPIATAVPELPDQPSQLVGDVVAGPHGEYALVAPCDSSSTGAGQVYAIAGGAARATGVTADFLLGGTHHAWRVTYPPPTVQSSGVTHQPGAVLTSLDGGVGITLATDAYPIADTAAGLVVARGDPTNPDSPPALELLDASTGAVVRALAAGYPLVAGAHVVLAQTRSCGFDQQVACTLERIDTATATVTRSYPLPVGRAITSLVTLSPDGRLAAFQLTRAAQDPRFETGHPAPPSDVVILHLDTGKIDVVPNLELAPKTQAGLAFDNSGTSLFITTSEGDHGQLLIWQHDMPGPAVVATVPGPITGAPPLLVLRR